MGRRFWGGPHGFQGERRGISYRQQSIKGGYRQLTADEGGGIITYLRGGRRNFDDRMVSGRTEGNQLSLTEYKGGGDYRQ